MLFSKKNLSTIDRSIRMVVAIALLMIAIVSDYAIVTKSLLAVAGVFELFSSLTGY